MTAKLYPKESAIQKAILDYLKLRGIFAIRINTQGVPLHDGSGKYRKAPQRGVSDILCILPVPSLTNGSTIGRFCAIEVKGRYGKLTTEQDKFLEQVRLHGGIAIFAKEVEDVELVLRKVGFGR